ncbi:transcriptional regulator, AraC family [Prevotella disiens JCM 6334 = ATCC 29426]|uniref:Transcriptional activator FtrA n=3 Tax=Prevotella disiens TaxID=28130 RepID=A0A379EFN4_9BACT|nr:helix-turn-helix domain-containing protein [Prevotella disiens]ERJ75774.1 transcriptional regulator, AraC family [Prevotella disiens JCM 6334 = ATCC 29426]SUB97462.1 transcriptional activator FtrA [Prevotella disiens]
MKFYNLNKHRQCPNYIGSKAMGFALITGMCGDRVGDILPVPVMIFVISGKIKLCYQKNVETVVNAGEMITAVFGNESYATAMEDTVCMRLYVQGDGLDFCHRIVNSNLLQRFGEQVGEQGKVLSMIPEIQAIVRQMTGYITDGLLCCNVHAMKQQELAAVLQAYYRPEDLLPFIAPIYDPNARFYNDVMKLADDYLPVKEMAARLNMSYPSFVRHFRKVFKETPLEWQSKHRMKRLTDMLRQTAHTEQEIADELKFSTVQNMRVFCKSRCGQTPAQVRNSKLGCAG